MPGWTQNSDRIGKPPKALHAGLNYDVALVDASATASLTCVANCFHIPRGARIASVYVIADCNGGGTGAESMLVKALTHNKVFLSATWAQIGAGVGTHDGASTKAYADMDYVFTASDTLVLESRNAVGTGTGSMSWKVAVSYTVENDQV